MNHRNVLMSCCSLFLFSLNSWLLILSMLPLFSSDFNNCSSECLCACSAEFPLELFFWTAVLRMHKICLSAASPFSVPAPSSEQHRRLQCSVNVLPFLRFVQSHQKFSTHVPVLFHWLVKGSSIFSCESPAFLHLPSPSCVCFTAPFWGSLCWLYRSFHSAVQAHIVVWITCVCSSPTVLSICALLWDTALLGDFIRLTLQKILSFWAADPRGV